MEDKRYLVYMHLCTKNKKVYIGVTSHDKEDRWKKGDGYTGNPKFYRDIVAFGWDDGFQHLVLQENLSFKEAKELEEQQIKAFDSTNPDKGYNTKKTGYSVPKERLSIGQKISNLRKQRKITQSQMAKDLNLVRATISNYEIGRRSPTIGDLNRFAAYFGVGLDYFGVGSDDLEDDIYVRFTEYLNSSKSVDDKKDFFNKLIKSYGLFIAKEEYQKDEKDDGPSNEDLEKIEEYRKKGWIKE